MQRRRRVLLWDQSEWIKDKSQLNKNLEKELRIYAIIRPGNFYTFYICIAFP
jgi:hypothetical protein